MREMYTDNDMAFAAAIARFLLVVSHALAVVVGVFIGWLLL